MSGEDEYHRHWVPATVALGLYLWNLYMTAVVNRIIRRD